MRAPSEALCPEAPEFDPQQLAWLPVRGPVGVGIIGAGAISSSHAAAYLGASGRARLVAIADVDEGRARRLSERFGVNDATADHRELLARKDISAVSICTPPATHAQIVLDAIDAGKHVLCEKPLVTSTEDGQALRDAASEHPGLRVSCVFQHRDDPSLRRARWILDRGLIGKVCSARVSAKAHRTASYYDGTRGLLHTDGGGALIVQGIHLLDAMLWLLGDAREVSARTGKLLHELEAEDTVAGWAQLTSGVLATVESTTCAHSDEYSITILGTEASLHLHYLPGWARMWHLEVRSDRPLHVHRISWKARRSVPPIRRARAFDIARLAAARVTSDERRPDHLGHGRHIRSFLDAVQYGRRAPVPPAEAYRSVELALALYRSASLGQAVSLPLCSAAARG